MYKERIVRYGALKDVWYLQYFDSRMYTWRDKYMKADPKKSRYVPVEFSSVKAAKKFCSVVDVEIVDFYKNFKK